MGRNLVVFFSRAGENADVGFVEEGNTSVVAHMISGKVISEVFEIKPQKAYPESYDECLDVAKQEQARSERPALAAGFDGLSEYDTVYLGYPIWWGDLPMCVYTFLESQDWTGKRIAPFCTHGGSGLSGTDATIKSVCTGATVLPGLAIRGDVAQNDSAQAEAAVNEWLAQVRSA